MDERQCEAVNRIVAGRIWGAGGVWMTRFQKAMAQGVAPSHSPNDENPAWWRELPKCNWHPGPSPLLSLGPGGDLGLLLFCSTRERQHLVGLSEFIQIVSPRLHHPDAL